MVSLHARLPSMLDDAASIDCLRCRMRTTHGKSLLTGKLGESLAVLPSWRGWLTYMYKTRKCAQRSATVLTACKLRDLTAGVLVI